MTIGKELSHVENALIDDVKHFFFKHYRPINAILVVAGKVKTADIKQLAQKWFGPIPMGDKYIRCLPQEPFKTKRED
jgi:zinc protease